MNKITKSEHTQKTPIKIRRRLMFIVFIIGYITISFLGQLSTVNEALTSTPEAIIACATVGISLILFPRNSGNVRQGIYPGLFRRFFAGYIDIYISTFLMFGFLFPILLLVENSARETWVWTWDAAISPLYWWVLTLGIIISFLGVYAYFRIHLERGRATPGQYMMGYKIIPTGEPNYNRRIWNGLLYFWLWFLAWTAGTEVDGTYKWDKNSNSQAVCIE